MKLSIDYGWVELQLGEVTEVLADSGVYHEFCPLAESAFWGKCPPLTTTTGTTTS